MHIQYFGSIRAAAQKSGEELEISSSTSLFRLLENLTKQYDEDFCGEILAEGRLRDDLTLSLNGRIVGHEASKDVFLQQDDTLALLPMFPGGG